MLGCDDIAYTKDFKRGESGLFFDHCVNAIGAAIILSVTYGGRVIVPVDCFGMISTNY